MKSKYATEGGAMYVDGERLKDLRGLSEEELKYFFDEAVVSHYHNSDMRSHGILNLISNEWTNRTLTKHTRRMTYMTFVITLLTVVNLIVVCFK